MADLSEAGAVQLANIEKRTGKSLAALTAMVKNSGLSKHGEMRDMLKRELGMGHGDANMLVHVALQSHGEAAAKGKSYDEVLDGIYTGEKAALRPVHEALLARIHAFGDFEIAPKKSYLSLRRSKQFATVGPATNSKIEIGLNMQNVEATDRLVAIPPGGMCNYKVRLGTTDEVDKELVAWIRTAYDASA